MLEHVVRVPVTQLRGIAAVVDCSGLSMTHAYYLTPTHIRRMISVVQVSREEEKSYSSFDIFHTFNASCRMFSVGLYILICHKCIMITNHILYKPFVQEVFPLRFKALHFVHEPSIFDWVFSLVKPFLSETIKGRVSILSELISDYITNVNYVCQNSHQKQELSAMISSY